MVQVFKQKEKAKNCGRMWPRGSLGLCTLYAQDAQSLPIKLTSFSRSNSRILCYYSSFVNFVSISTKKHLQNEDELGNLEKREENR